MQATANFYAYRKREPQAKTASHNDIINQMLRRHLNRKNHAEHKNQQANPKLTRREAKAEEWKVPIRHEAARIATGREALKDELWSISAI